jgi:hypothetical protein
MALDPIPTSFQSDGLHTITYVPAASNPLSAAILNGGTAKDVTYGLTADGFNYAVTQAEVPDKRYTLQQDLSAPGKTKETLVLRYVDTTDAGSPAVTFTEGLRGYLVVRRQVANGTAYAAAQIVDVLDVQFGKQSPDAPSENGLDTITQGTYFKSATQRKATVVA